jgi:trans-aconitate methyltransferase
MIKRVSVVMAALLCVPVISMEHSISPDMRAMLEPHADRAKKIISKLDIAQYPHIVEVGSKSGLIAEFIAAQAPKSLVTATYNSQNPIDLSVLSKHNLTFVKQDTLDLSVKADLIALLAQLPWVQDKKTYVANVVENLASGGTLVATCVAPNESLLIKAFFEIKEDPRWKSEFDKLNMDVLNKLWLPTKKEDVEKILTDGGLTLIKTELDDSPVVFENAAAFKTFVHGVMIRLKTRIGDSQTLNNKERLDAYIETLTQKYLSYLPAKENGNVHYHIPENVFVYKKNN